MAGDSTLDAGGAGTSAGGSRLTRSLAALILLVVVIAAAIWLLLPRTTTVPDVTGLAAADAQAKIENAGYKAGVVAKQESDKAAAGIVIGQKPAAGTVADKGALVDLTVAAAPTGIASSAPATPAGGVGVPKGSVLVPNVLGKSQDDARASITGGKLLATFTSTSDGSPVGTVIHQYPDAGTSAPPGTVVDVVLSAGLSSSTAAVTAGGTQVPSVVGLSLSAAQSKLSNAGWNWTVQYGPGTAVPSGVVYFQSPAADAFAARQTVSIWISTGSKTGGWPYGRPPLNDHPGQ